MRIPQREVVETAFRIAASYALTIEHEGHRMTKRESYPAGAPCWVETLQPEPRSALAFYGPLLGWTFDDASPMPDGLDDVEDTVRRAEAAGGTRLSRGLDAGPNGRMAVLADASDVPFCLWQPGTRVGAEVVGEAGTWAMSSLPHRRPRAGTGVLRQPVRLAARSCAWRRVPPTAARRGGHRRRNADGWRRGSAALERQLRR
jgi:predicted enzyme related to lactoylglutathione lyase